MIFILAGCEAFGKKFIRKHKDTDGQVEMVLEPKVYPDHPFPSEEVYRETFNFWKTWHEELLNSLVADGNKKKQKECVDYTIENLKRLKSLLREEKAKLLGQEIDELDKARQKIELPILNETDMVVLKNNLDRQKMKIDREFVYSKVKDYLLK
jgi:hypothetical protein